MQGKAPKDNVVLIVCDCLRNDHAYDPVIMPFLNEFKDSNSYTEKAYTNATNTHLAMPTMMTGYMPFERTNRSGINRKIANRYLPKVLKSNRYKTYGITANIVTSGNFGYNLSWDSWEDFWEKKKGQSKQITIRKISDKLPQSLKDSVLSPIRKLVRKQMPAQITDVKNKVRADQVYERVKSLPLEKEGNFIFLHLMEPHSPYGTKDDIEKYGEKAIKALTSKVYDNPKKLSFEDILFLRRLYKNECIFLDKMLMKIITYLFKVLDEKNTKVIITADHGEALGETDYFMHKSTEVSNTHHIKIPLISKGFDLDRKRGYWTIDIYNSCMPFKELEVEIKPYCIGYKKTTVSLPGIVSSYEPCIIYDTEKITDVKKVRELPYMVGKEEIIDDLSI